jgi:uncharacterized protein YbbC (DUF1343 family)
MKISILFCLVLLILTGCRSFDSQIIVQTGLDRIGEYQDIFTNKQIGIITNHTGYDSQNRFILDRISSLPNTKVVALFGPEHGIFGAEAAGHSIKDTIDHKTNIPIYSLYGKIRKPTIEMLQNIDLLVFDIQDIGARFYTYIYTMALSMEAAAENGIPFVVLDRPNPINGIQVEGNVLDTTFATFVGLYPIPVRHGMTVGELAMMINGEGWLTNHVQANLTIIPASNWQRDMWYDQTGLPWHSPSPNIPDLMVATAYPGMCLFEGTNVSEGRGTYQPFLRIGAPWLNLKSFEMVNKIVDMPGVHFGPISFIPKSIKSMSPNPKHLDKEVFGVSINITDRQNYQSYLTGIALVKYFHDANPKKFEWRERHFDRLCGTDVIRKFIQQGKTVEQIKSWIEKQEVEFKKMRKKYLLY